MITVTTVDVLSPLLTLHILWWVSNVLHRVRGEVEPEGK